MKTKQKKAEDLTRLIIRRRIGESIKIDGPAEIKIDKMENNSVEVCFVAPRSTKIRRKELG